MNEKVWAEIPGYPNYLASNAGEIYSTLKNKPLKQTVSKFGYARVTLYKSGKEKHKIMVHRLVALSFIENPNNYAQVNHINENKLDNRVENLEWCTPSYNINYGERNRKVSEKMKEHKKETDAKKIAQIEPSTGAVVKIWDSMREIERELGFAHSNIYACCTGKRKTRGGFKWKYAS